MKRSASIFGTPRLSILTIHTLLLTLLVTAPLPLSARKWLITSHDQLKTNKINDRQSWADTDPACYKNTEDINRAPDGTKRFCDIALLGLRDGDPEKDKDVKDTKVDGHDTAPWMSVDNPAEPNYIEVDISENPINLTDGNTIAVYTKRHTVNALSHPTGFRIEASTDGTHYETVAYAYFLYRGINTTAENWGSTLKGTKEYSARIKIDESWTKYKHLRFYVTANNTKNRVRGDGGTLTENRKMTMAAFNVMQLNEDEHYSDILVDRFHLVTDYSYKYYYYDFVPTLGIFHPNNRYHSIITNEWGSSTEVYKNLKDFTIYPDEDPGNSPWEKFTDEKGSGYRWKKDLDYLKVAGIEMPVYQWQTHLNDKFISKLDKVTNIRRKAVKTTDDDGNEIVSYETKTESTTVDNRRQPVHVVEHELYAIPGDAIALYPFYELANDYKGQKKPDRYNVRFTHWYNYRTGGNVTDATGQTDLLDFLVDPSLVCKSKDYGYYGGMAVARKYKKSDPNASSGENPGQSGEVKIKNIDDYKGFVTRVNNGETTLNAKIEVEKDETDLCILDFSGETDIASIGTSTNPYKGTFDGNGCIIKNLVINKSSENNIGMFGVISGTSNSNSATIKNLYIDNTCKFIGNENVGIIGSAAYVWGVNYEISNIITSAEISASKSGGGIIGNQEGGILSISNCYICGTISATTDAAIIGNVVTYGQATINNCISTIKSQSDDLKFAYSEWGNESDKYNNCYTLIAPEYDNDRGILKLTEDNGRFYIEKNKIENADGSLPEKIYVDSSDFASLLGSEEWIFDSSLGLVPFKKLQHDSDDPQPEHEEEIDYDLIENLGTVRDRIYGENKTNDPVERIKTVKNLYDVGAVATFLCTRTTTTDENGELESLPDAPFAQGEDKDFIIAADLVTVISDLDHKDSNFDPEGKKIYEPTILFRHIFHVKDGKAFAEEFSGSPQNNLKYVRRNRRIITARSDAKKFQIRLDCPIPVQKEGQLPPPSKYYYKISNSDYRRVRGAQIAVYKMDENGDAIGEDINDKKDPIYNEWNQITGYTGIKFDFGTDYDTFREYNGFEGYGKRNFEDTDYLTCGGGGEYYRMLRGYNAGSNEKDPGSGSNIPVGKYLVRLYALDINGNPIYVYDGTNSNENHKLITEEFEIHIVESNEAKILDLDQGIAEDQNMEKTYLKPTAKIDFDEYYYLTKSKTGTSETGVDNTNDYTIGTADNCYFKWPMPWDKVNYGFGHSIYLNNHDKNQGYEQLHDFNYDIYTLANNMASVHWHSAVSEEQDITYHKTKNTPEKKNGFFFWMNAASDPGVAAKLEIGNLCSGSIIHVSAWMIEVSDPVDNETANMSFNFVAVSKNGDRKKIHSYVSGYIEKGKWKRVNYQFKPDYEKIEEMAEDGFVVDHYEIELENNCKNSESADYAIDEIRVYVVAPEVKAEQLEPICEETTSTKVKVSLSFETFITALGMTEVKKNEDNQYTPESPKDIKLFYSFLDKDIFDKEFNRSNDQETAFSKAVLQYNYNGTGEANQTYGILNFSNCFDDLEKYPQLADILNSENNGSYIGKPFGETEDSGTRNLVIITQPENENQFIAGQQYYIAIYMDETGEITEPKYTEFDVANNCSNKGVFTVQSANKLVIVPDNNSEGIAPDGEFCLGSSPIVKLNFTKKGTNGEVADIEPDKAGYDWYAGSMTQLEEEKMAENGLTLQEVLAKFREKNTATTEENIADAAIDNEFTKAMREYLVKLTQERVKDGRPKLRLGGFEYKFTPGKLIATVKDSVNYVTAIPFYDETYKGEHSDVLFCNSPVEARLKVSSHSPGMTHGLNIDYPDEIIDVPLRMGLKQIKAAMTNDRTLRIPLLKVESPSKLATRLRLRKINNSEDEPVYLLETNDPAYRTVMLEAAKEEKLSDDELFPVVGHIAGMTATKTDIPKKDNAFYVKFDNVPTWSKPGASAAEGSTEKPFEFHEGYYYTLKFNIAEDGGDDFLTSDACPGQHIFTIKVVPEYLKWNGAQPKADSGTDANGKSLNWNNDNNWSRVYADDLYWDDTKATNNVDYIVDKNYNSKLDDVYAPLDFTKVIIGNGAEYPRMYHVTDEAVEGTDLDSHLWSNLHETETTTNNAPANGAGDATHHIYYDMAAYTKDIPTTFNKPDGVSGIAVSCRPWYANTAEQVHFLTNSEVYAQQHLRYDKAWVDMEMKPDNWYTTASPLQSIYAGDMYLPTQGARQETPLFEGINFDNELKINDRFRPAVYQRSWNRASDNIYEENKPKAPREAFVSLDWSNVYNDVQVKYASGEGFSIKTDVSEATDFTKDGNVLFRFPKEDTNYQYFVYYDETDRYKNVSHDVPKSEGHGKLNPTNGSITINANGTNPYFLVGNPFMAHLDMKKFLKKNASKIESTYWLLNSAKQTVTIIDGDGTPISSDGNATTTLLPPMAGFFVKAKTTGDLTLSYDETMMHVDLPKETGTGLWLDPTQQSVSPSPSTRAAGMPGMIRISSVENGKTVNTALLLLGAAYDPAATAGEDAETVIDPELGVATVFTVADGNALSINALPDALGTEVGIDARAGQTTTLRFDGDGCGEGYFLTDTLTGESTPISEGMEYEVTGGAKGRLFITDGVAQSMTGIRIEQREDGEVTVTSADGSAIEVTVSDTLGRVLMRFAEGKPEVHFRPEAGVIVVHATNGVHTATKKLF